MLDRKTSVWQYTGVWLGPYRKIGIFFSVLFFVDWIVGDRNVKDSRYCLPKERGMFSQVMTGSSTCCVPALVN